MPYGKEPPKKKEDFGSEANQALKEKAFDYLRRYASDSEQLRINREDALKSYRRDPYAEDAKVAEGSRSKFVMSDTSDTIEWILPSLMRVFYSGKEVVKIEGQGVEDTVGADLLNAKVNWDFTRQNNGFLILYDWFKASMLNKFTVVKYWWDSHDEYEDMVIDDVTEQEYAVLVADPDFTIIKEGEPVLEFDEAGMTVSATRKIEGKRVKRKIRRPVAEVVPPEEFIGSIKMRNIKDEEFVAHRKKLHKADLMREYDVSEDELQYEADILTNGDSEVYERFKDLGGVGFFRDEDDADSYYIYECCMKEDKEDRRIPIFLTLMGSRIIRKEPNTYGRPNYCMLSPIRMPFRAIGMSIYDLVGDLQKLKSALARYLLNNIYYQTESMMIVNDWKINLADFVTQRRPGGIIRTKDSTVVPSEAVHMLQPQPLAGHAYGLLDAIDSWKEKRTGVTSYNQGVDADSLNKTARGISEIMAASQQRVELIARIYAETGVRDLLTAFAEMNIEFLDVETNIRLDQQWVEVDPKAIDVLFDVTVDVALGTGGREMKVQQTGAMLDRSLNPTLIASGVVQPQNVYELMKTIYLEMGYKNVDKYVTNPSQLQPAMPGVMNAQAGAGQQLGMAGPPGAGVPAGSPMVQ